jgi:hypothetical protein
MVQADSKLVSPNLHKIHLDYANPMDWMPRSQPDRVLSPGLQELTKGNDPDLRWGWNDKYMKQQNWTPRCRFCGSPMFIVEETANAFVFGCALETCPNNQDNWKDANFFYRQAKKRMGKICEDAWGREFPSDYEIPADMQQFFQPQQKWVTV